MMRASLAAGGLALSGGLLSVNASSAQRAKVGMQLSFLANGNQVGEVAAKQLGYYEQENIDFSILPGGPSSDGIAVIASGRVPIGQASSSPTLMLASSQGLPIRCFATGLQEHPYCFFSLRKNPVRTPQDMIGKTIGIQPAGAVLLQALLTKNHVPKDKVRVVPVSGDMLPLLTGRVDAIAGWQTNTTALKPLGADRVDMRLWDFGIRLYALPYYAATSTIETNAEMLKRFLRATAKGWFFANANRDSAVDMLVKAYPNLNRDDERAAIDVLMKYAFNEQTRRGGWGTMDPAVWEDQISTYADLGQFSGAAPKPEDVYTLSILKATQSDRMKG